ncbi:four helix bundle protein [Echinicola marina]|uniref:four helix bundle protein n=1 Tax=Echinicola marina TaxID=2859768 RepID=UPI001CF65909|nr:four helix bundle protein [Echinicola marina]UCS93602.1 four helix bundle protein [Echinicola marina]
MNSFEELEVWGKARDLRVFAANLVSDFPVEEKFVLVSQVKKSSRSIGNNIAEGFGRGTYDENIQFCRQARGSLFETLDHMIVAFDEGLISIDDLKDYRDYHYDCLKLLNGHISSIKKSRKL